MNHHLTEEEIAMCAEALERNEYDSLPKSIRKHLFECDQCADEVLMVADVAGDIQLKSPEKKPAQGKTKRIIAWSISIAAAAGLVLFITDLNFSSGPEGNGSETFLSQNEQEQETSKTDDQDSQQKKESERDTSLREETLTADNNSTEEQSSKDKNATSSPVPGEEAPAASAMPPVTKDGADTLKLLAHLVPNEELEKLTERFEGNMRDDGSVSVKSPMTITSSDSNITIKWNNPEKKRLIIEVLDNEGQKILEDETQGEQYTIENLSDGLYYWKLISSNFDLLFCGKIVVKN